MESSTVLAFRIFVMLSCLIIVPLAAIFGSAFPDVVKTVLVDRIVALGTGKPVESNRAASEAEGFHAVISAPPADRPNNWEAPRWGTPHGQAASWQEVPAPQVISAGGPLVASGYNQSASFAAPSHSDAVESPVQRLDAPPAYGQQHASAFDGRPDIGEPGPVPSAAPAYPSPSVDRSAVAVEQPERFKELERRLREHGATYYLLETRGSEGEQYRFFCRMAIANHSHVTRDFEATGPDALKAMSEVIEHVEAWRSGRLP